MIPPAMCGWKPALRIIGIVNVPVVTALATALPESDPINPLPATETMAGPPVNRPKIRCAKSMMNFVAPLISKNAPKTTNKNTYVNITRIATPKIPLLPKKH